MKKLYWKKQCTYNKDITGKVLRMVAIWILID